MPHSMPFGEQENKWFTFVLIIILPFYVLFKILKNDLPGLDKARPK